MVKMNFVDPILERIIRRWKWSRNNTILLFESALEQSIFDYMPKSDIVSKHEPHPVLYQFQCIVTTTNTYYRKLTNNVSQSFGILVEDGKITKKEDISKEKVISQLKSQIVELENFLKPYTQKDLERNIKEIMTISDHEYLHQGQLIVLFREAGAKFPDRFSKAWALGNK